MITIKNEFLTAKINELGAELKSLVYNNKEYIWQANPKYWNSSAPILFPICSRLKDETYYFKGKKYNLGMHGYARKSYFTLESYEDNSATFLLTSNEESKKQYPFEYELRVIYTLIEKQIIIRYEVKNCDDDNMYFSIGAHEGYCCDEGIEEYEIILPKKETLNAYQLSGSVLTNETKCVLENSNVIPLKNKMFEIDALIFKDLKAREMVLRNKRDKRAIKLKFDGFDYFLIWTKPNAPYLCLEPWCGITDNIDTDQNLVNKEGIQLLKGNSVFIREHSIEILK